MYQQQRYEGFRFRACSADFWSASVLFFDDETQAEPQHKTPKKSGYVYSSTPETSANHLSYKELQTKIKTLEKEIAHLKTAEQVSLRQLEINHNYITMLESRISKLLDSKEIKSNV